MKLPKVFAVPNNENIRNNESFSYNKNNNIERNESVIREKINKIFKREEPVYSIDCLITFKDHKKKCTIIGATSNHLITKERKLISINDVYDISLE